MGRSQHASRGTAFGSVIVAVILHIVAARLRANERPTPWLMGFGRASVVLCWISCGHDPDSGCAQWSRSSQVFYAEYPCLNDGVIRCATEQLAWTLQGPQSRSVHTLLLRWRGIIHCRCVETEEPVSVVLTIHFDGAEAACSAFEDHGASECTCGTYVVMGRHAIATGVVAIHPLAARVAYTHSRQLVWAHGGHPVGAPNLEPR